MESQELKERIEEVGTQKSESKLSEEMLEIRKAFVRIHGEMVLLKNYSSLNFMGKQGHPRLLPLPLLLRILLLLLLLLPLLLPLLLLFFSPFVLNPHAVPVLPHAGLVKILKKYDKRTGGLLRLPFIQRALRQPFFSTEPLTRLVRECEANLELLFPLEPEVLDSAAAADPLRHASPSPPPPPPAEASGDAQHGTIDVYRSTLAAMRAIQGLRRASSTYSPLSLAQFFRDGDDGGAGDLTAENSVSNSSASNDPDPEPAAAAATANSSSN